MEKAVRHFQEELEALQALAATCPDRLEVASEPAEVAARLARCHFALTAGNGWSISRSRRYNAATANARAGLSSSRT